MRACFTCPASASDRKLSVELELRYQSRPWSARERVKIRGMEDYLEKSGVFLVGVDELEALLGSTDVAGIITALAEEACEGPGSRRFELIETSEGQMWLLHGGTR